MSSSVFRLGALALAAFISVAAAANQTISLCPGYSASNERLHVKIYDPALQVYQVPQSVLPRPNGTSSSARDSVLEFSFIKKPFSFSVRRKSSGEVLFDTSGSPLIFESQYLNLRTKLPANPNLYGLGEHTDPYRLNTTNYTRTLWSRDAYGVPSGTNLYGNHPVYFDHRGAAGTHAVFLLNSNGMDIKINNTAEDGQYLEYNVVGGILDLYFFAGPTPKAVAQQYADAIGYAVMMPYWGFGFHQCKYGYQDVFEVAEVVANYSTAGIPLETMWTDIDYMYYRRVFTLDPERFPLEKMQELVATLHARQQHYVVMVDPAVAYQDYPAFNDGVEADAFLKRADGSVYKGVVWPGVTAFPDWFASGTQGYWNGQFDSFFNDETGVGIDALWIDMNEASNFCNYPCSDPEAQAAEMGDPPQPAPLRNNSRPDIPGFPADFQPSATLVSRLVRFVRQTSGGMLGLPRSDDDLEVPPYMIQDAAGSLSNKTIDVTLRHENGLVEYDTHNLYGTMMSVASRAAMLSRRPTRRPMVITRSTFAGAGAHVGHWLGDNFADWDHYRISISGLLQFASLFQVPMVGSDVCGYADNTTETLCARWATLGAFSPFYRNHASTGKSYQEFYRWPTVATAAKNAIDARYRLLDYIYTALHKQTVDGTPLINPVWFNYPEDSNTFPLQYQYFYGESLLVSPVIQENVTDVSIYLPNDLFYDFWTHAPVRGQGEYVTLSDVPFTTIPLHYKGGTIFPLRVESANTTTELRKKGFEIVIAPGLNGKAKGTLYLDEGDAIEQPETSQITLSYANGKLSIGGTFGYTEGLVIEKITLLGVSESSSDGYGHGHLHGGWGSYGGSGSYSFGGHKGYSGHWKREGSGYDASSQSLTKTVSLPLTKAASVTLL